MEIVEYHNSTNTVVMFEDGTKVRASYGSFKKGSVSNPKSKSICGIGYRGEKNDKTVDTCMRNKAFGVWNHMISRCYGDMQHKYYQAYKDCSVCDEWHNSQNFIRWYSENYYDVGSEKICLDKDILVKNNRIYGPQTCLIVPNRVNCLFAKASKIRGELPIGVSKDNRNGRYVAHITEGSASHRFLGYFTTPEEAFLAYKTAKEAYVKQVADEYKNKIPQKLYDALYVYEVEITD